MQPLEGEIIYFSIDSATVLWYRILSFSLIWRKKITVTSKRIIVSFSWFGVESYRGGTSFFYNEHKGELSKRSRSILITKYTIGKSRFFGKYIKLTTGRGLIKPRVIIFTSYSDRIGEIISNTN